MSVKVDDRYYYSPESTKYRRLNEFISDEKQLYRFADYGIQSSEDGISFTLKANMGTYYDRVPIIKDNFGIRNITPSECLALQGFPKEFMFPSSVPERERYKQAGNTVCITFLFNTIKQSNILFFADDKGEIQDAHRLIASFPLKDIWTTNYDTLIERAFSCNNISTTVITNDESYKNIDRTAKVKIHKIHGSVKNASKCVIARQDYDLFPQTHDIVLSELKGEMCSNSFLFLGYSFSDTDIQHILTKIRLEYENEHTY